MRITFDEISKLETIRSELTEVLRQLHEHRDLPGGDIDTAIQHLKNAMAEIDRSIAELPR